MKSDSRQRAPAGVLQKFTVGLTYDLREDYLKEGYSLEETAEFDKAETIDAIENVILQNGLATVRIGHIKELTRRLARGERWELVFNIAEGLHGFGREAQIPALLDAFQIPYTFSDALGQALALHKGMSKRIIRDLGLPTPDFALVSGPEDIDGITLPYPLFAKPVAEGTSKGISARCKMDSPGQLKEVCSSLLQTFHQPVLVETYLPGREFTVGIIGTGKDARVIGVMEALFNPEAEPYAYSYENKEHYENLVRYVLAQDDEAAHAAEISLLAWRGLGLQDGGRVDLRSDACGLPHFIEVNALAGLNPVRSDLPILCSLVGLPYEKLISEILFSACQRAGLQISGLSDYPAVGRAENYS